jgi:hypothetical protein
VSRKDMVLRMKFLAMKSLGLMPLCLVLLVSMLMLNGNDLAFALARLRYTTSTQGASSHQRTRTFWIQVMDSCERALPGAYFVYQVDGRTIQAGPTAGTKPVTVAVSSTCPLQRGHCVGSSSTGCLTFNIPIPASGSTTYTLKETKAPRGYMPCTGGSVCSGGPEVVTVHISSSGTISATVFNVYPNGRTVTWPTSGAPYQGTPLDPAVLHNYGIGNISCDGDHDADDHLSGGWNPYCDSDDDR